MKNIYVALMGVLALGGCATVQTDTKTSSNAVQAAAAAHEDYSEDRDVSSYRMQLGREVFALDLININKNAVEFQVMTNKEAFLKDTPAEPKIIFHVKGPKSEELFYVAEKKNLFDMANRIDLVDYLHESGMPVPHEKVINLAVIHFQMRVSDLQKIGQSQSVDMSVETSQGTLPIHFDQGALQWFSRNAQKIR